MAKATATCTCSKCGAEFEKIAFKRNRREADSWEEWAVDTFKTCPDCEQKEYEERMAKVAEDAKSNGLPELTGSPKQINWAVGLREKMLAAVNEVMVNTKSQLGKEADPAVNEKNAQIYEEFEITVEYLKSQTASTFWIDNRSESASAMLINYRAKAVEAHKAKAEAEAEAEAETTDAPQDDESLIVPDDETEGTVEIIVEDGKVSAIYQKDDKFREIIKSAGYRWNPQSVCWQRTITERTGSAVDRAAELAHRLLDAGFSVRCDNAIVRSRATTGFYEAEHKRWISGFTAGEFKDWLKIEIPKRYADPESEKLYKVAREIKDSKWSRDEGSVIAPIEQYEEIAKFAQDHDYQYTKSAIATINGWLFTAASRSMENPEEAAV